MSSNIRHALHEALCHPISSQSARRTVIVLGADVLITGLFVFILAAALHFNGSALLQILSQRKALILFGGTTVGFIGLFYIIFGPKKDILSQSEHPSQQSSLPSPLASSSSASPSPPPIIAPPLPPPALRTLSLSPHTLSLSPDDPSPGPKSVSVVLPPVGEESQDLAEDTERQSTECASLQTIKQELSDSLATLQRQDREHTERLAQQIAEFQEARRIFYAFPQRDIQKIQERLAILHTYYPSIPTNCLEWPSLELPTLEHPESRALSFDLMSTASSQVDKPLRKEEDEELNRQIDALSNEISQIKKEMLRLQYEQHSRRFTLEEFQRKTTFQKSINEQLTKLHEQLGIISPELVNIEQVLLDRQENAFLRLFSKTKEVSQQDLNARLGRLIIALRSFKEIAKDIDAQKARFIKDCSPPSPTSRPVSPRPVTSGTPLPPPATAIVPPPTAAIESDIDRSAMSLTSSPPPLIPHPASLSSSVAPASRSTDPVVSAGATSSRSSRSVTVSERVEAHTSSSSSPHVDMESLWGKMGSLIDDISISLLNIMLAIYTKKKGRPLTPLEIDITFANCRPLFYQIKSTLASNKDFIQKIIKNIYLHKKYKSTIRSKDHLMRLIFIAFNSKDFDKARELLNKLGIVEQSTKVANLLIAHKKILQELDKQSRKKFSAQQKIKITALQSELYDAISRIKLTSTHEICVKTELETLRNLIKDKGLERKLADSLLKIVPSHPSATIESTNDFFDKEEELNFGDYLTPYEGQINYSLMYKIIAHEIAPLLFKAMAGADFAQQATSCITIQAAILDTILFRSTLSKFQESAQLLDNEMRFNIESGKELVAFLKDYPEREARSLREEILFHCVYKDRWDAPIHTRRDVERDLHHLIPENTHIVPCSSEKLTHRVKHDKLGEFSVREIPHKISWTKITVLTWGKAVVEFFEKETPTDRINKELFNVILELLEPSENSFRREILSAIETTYKTHLTAPLERLAMQEFDPLAALETINDCLTKISTAICPKFIRYSPED